MLAHASSVTAKSTHSISNFSMCGTVRRYHSLLRGFNKRACTTKLSVGIRGMPTFARHFRAFMSRRVLPRRADTMVSVSTRVSFESVAPGFFDSLGGFGPFKPSGRGPVFYARRICSCNADGIIKHSRRRVGLRLMSGGSGGMVGNVTFNRDSRMHCVGAGHSFSVYCAVRRGARGHNRMRLRVRSVGPVR